MSSALKIAVYPGSFDPIHLGHIDIIQRISKVFDQVIVLISEAPEKKSEFDITARKKMISESLKGLKNITVDSHEGLTVDYMRRVKAKTIVRGLRAVVDFEYEMTMANMNKKLAPDIETLLVFASPEYYYISSRGVKEVAKHKGSLDGLVSESVKKSLTSSRKPKK